MREARECFDYIRETFAVPIEQRLGNVVWSEDALKLAQGGDFDFTLDMLVWQVEPDNLNGSISVSGRPDVIRALEDILLDERIEFKRLTEDGVIFIASQ